MGRPPTKAITRVWNRVDKSSSCWIWTGKITSSGYGSVYEGGRQLPVHKVVWESIHGPVPDGLTLDHTCHNDADCEGGDECLHRRCCNPEHIEAVSRAENVRRGRAGLKTGRRNREKTHCNRGHEYTPSNTFVRNGKRECRECRLTVWTKKKTL